MLSKTAKGFRVNYDTHEGYVYVSRHLPDKNEELIPTENEAWEQARELAKETDASVGNIYVIDEHFKPVDNYRSKMLKPLY